MRIISRKKTILEYRYDYEKQAKYVARIDLFEVCSKINSIFLLGGLVGYCAIPGTREDIIIYRVKNKIFGVTYIFVNWAVVIDREGKTNLKACLVTPIQIDLYKLSGLIETIHKVRLYGGRGDAFLVLHKDIETLCQLILKSELEQN